MNIVGIIAEYNPFHNGHLYQINKIKETIDNPIIICVVSSSFCQRGNISVLNKWDKAEIALHNGVDIVIELPFVFSTQSADIFAKGALELLNEMKINYLCFGSESGNIELLEQIVKEQENKNYDNKVKIYLDRGFNYPTAMAKALKNEYNLNETPNDLLAISYLKCINNHKYNIKPLAIKRTNDYHSKNLSSSISSATAIRDALNKNKEIANYIPGYKEKLLYKNYDNNYFQYLQYKIIADNDLAKYQTVDEGIENKIIKEINNSTSLEELVNNIKSKRYTYNKITRMLTHILVSFTKEQATFFRKNEYIRILGLSKNGQKYLNKIKKTTLLPIITGYKNNNFEILNFEYKVNKIYSLIVEDKSLIKREIEKPIIK